MHKGEGCSSQRKISSGKRKSPVTLLHLRALALLCMGMGDGYGSESQTPESLAVIQEDLLLFTEELQRCSWILQDRHLVPFKSPSAFLSA